MMRILILDNEFPPLGGGTGVINYHHMQELDRAGQVYFDLVTSSRTFAQHEVEPFGASGRIFKVPVNNRNIHHSSNIELLRYAWRGLRQSWRLLRQQPYDICWAYSTVPAGFIAMLLRWFKRLPYIVITQGPDIPWYEQRYHRLYYILKPVIKLIWRQAASVTAQSSASRDMIWKTAPHLQVEVIPNGVEVDRFATGGRSLKQRNQPQPLTFLCVGRLIERKGQQHLLDAAAMLNQRGYNGQFRIVFVGTGDNEHRLQAQSGRLNLADEVVFEGVAEHGVMPRYYAQADVFVLPSYNEGMSVALLEALAAGLPVIVTDTGGTRELVDGNGFVVKWADPVGLAAALEKFLREPWLCRALGEQSRQIVQKYSWQAAAKRYIDLCRQDAPETP